ncbi:MAG: RraA family protein [Verrucomicrobia bacterium]|nr:RraA family protein [Verrucomicrobiota bacterium]
MSSLEDTTPRSIATSPSEFQDSYGDRLEVCYSGAVYDVLRAMGLPDQILPRTIRSLDPTRALAGRIFTVSGHLDFTVDGHTTLLEWTRMLSKAPSGSVVVCQPNDDSLAHMGELSAETFVYKGVRGYLCDGGCRDSVRILETGLRVWSRYFTPRDVVGRWVPGGFGEPIVIGGVSIRSGDYLMADRDGALIIPQEHIQEVTEKVEEVLRTENKVRTAILNGVDPVEAYLRFRKF